MSADEPGLDLLCVQIVELVTDYLEGALDEPTRRSFEEHLAVCEGCGIYVEQIRATMALTGRASAEVLSDDARRMLTEAFRSLRAS